MQHQGVKGCLQVRWQGVSDLQHLRCKELFTGELVRCIKFVTPRCKELFTGALARCKELFTDGSERCVISATPRCKEVVYRRDGEVCQICNTGDGFFLFYKRLYIILFLYSKHKNIKKY